MIIQRPAFRKIKAFAFDPSLQQISDSVSMNCVEIEIPWECDPNDSSKDGPAPGPIGEYIEVIDYDDSEGKFYHPVDLNNNYLLAQSGHQPSDGNPQFHQQMVYAVAMKTIKNFERALGRPILWAPIYRKVNSRTITRYVKSLRMYPHAFQGANAYYSPERKAILFGYFRAPIETNGTILPGGFIFTCLSHDIIVHELTHAILDGIHPKYIEFSNPDLRAFHEAFADIVAIFQHFTFIEVVRHQIAKTKGRLRDKNFLNELAREFGHAIGRASALRTAIINDFSPEKLTKSNEPHERGAILVAAIFDAFFTIYEKRIQDLLRLSTSGTGVLREGAIHPDLVDRLSREATKTAEHVLNICIRALDYMPPVDATFGDFLRALITSDHDLVPNDKYRYRVAFIEAFGKYGIYPEKVRSLSEYSLLWEGPEKRGAEGERIFEISNSLMNDISRWDQDMNRRQLYEEMRKAQTRIYRAINQTKYQRNNTIKGINFFKYDKYEVNSIRPVKRVGPNGQLLVDVLIEIIQSRKDYNLTNINENINGYSFNGGCTLIIDMKTGRLRYCISKDIDETDRMDKQLKYLNENSSLRNTYYRKSDLKSEDSPYYSINSI